MNKLLSLLAALFLLALPTVAQETDVSEEEFRQKVDSVFEHVNLKQVETGILLSIKITFEDGRRDDCNFILIFRPSSNFQIETI